MPLTDQPVKGMYLREDSRFFYLQDRKLKTQGRQGGLVIMKMKALDNGQILTRTVKSGTKIEYINPETREVQYLYSDTTGVNFMDMVTFETITIAKDVIGEYINFLKEGDPILILTYEDQILSVKEHSSVILEVTQADDAVKGNTANSATKVVTVETGYKLNVPMFIRKGDKLKINTETGEYSGKANS
jgi:elongation factor P